MAKKKSKKLKKDSQLVIRVNSLMRNDFIELCEDLDSSAAREIRRFMTDFMKEHKKKLLDSSDT